MKTFTGKMGFFRHAKADPNGDELTRPLLQKGIEQAKLQAKRVNIKWQHVYSSPAERAIQTAIILSGMIPKEIDLLYANSEPTEALIEEIREDLILDAQAGNVLIVSHQPMIAALVLGFSGCDVSSEDIKAGEGVVVDSSGSIEVFKLG